MNRFEQIKNMNIEELAEWLAQRYTICDMEARCGNCVNSEWCDCSEAEDFKKWLEKIC